MIEKNQTAPAFQFETQFHTWVNQEQLRGRVILMFFLPNLAYLSDQVLLMSYMKAYDRFAAMNVCVIGVCGETTIDIRQTALHFKLPFFLTEDLDHTVRNAYDVWHEKMICGSKRWVMDRSALIIDEFGNVMKTYRRIKLEDHVYDVLDFLEHLHEKKTWQSLSRREKEKIRKSQDNET